MCWGMKLTTTAMVRTVQINVTCQLDMNATNGSTLMTLGSDFWIASGGEEQEGRGNLFFCCPMLSDCRGIVGLALPHCELRAGKQAPLDKGPVLCLVRGRANSPTVMTPGTLCLSDLFLKESLEITVVETRYETSLFSFVALVLKQNVMTSFSPYLQEGNGLQSWLTLGSKCSLQFPRFILKKKKPLQSSGRPLLPASAYGCCSKISHRSCQKW